MEKSLWLLVQLWTYKFLTISQFENIWWSQSKKSLYWNLHSLKERKLIGVTKYGYHPKYWRVEDMYFLLPKGSEIISNKFWKAMSQVKDSRTHKWFFEDYHHRKMTISCQIAMSKDFKKRWTKNLSYENYFEKNKGPNNLRTQTATKLNIWESFIIPDSILIAEFNDKKILFCFELHNGYRVLRIEQKLEAYAYIIAKGVTAAKYNLKTNPYILNVFEKESTMTSVLERLSQNHFYLYLKEYYLFKTYEGLMINPFEDWINLKQKLISLLQLHNGKE